MPAAAAHTIRLQRLDVTLNGAESDGFALQNRLSAWCNDRLPQAISQALEPFAPAEGNLVIEYLDVDAGELSLEHFEQEFPECVRRAVEHAIRDKLAAVPVAASTPSDSPDAVFKSEAQVTLEAFLFFLETGRLPWAFRLLPGKTLEDQVLEVRAAGPEVGRFWAEFRLRLASQAVRSRLIRQFSLAFLSDLTKRISPDPVSGAHQVLAIWRPVLQPEAFAFWERVVWLTALAQQAGVAMPRLTGEQHRVADTPEHVPQLLFAGLHEAERQRPGFIRILRTAIGPEPVQPWAKAVLAEIQSAPPPTLGPDAALERQPGSEPPLEGLLLDCAGLVLLHPFLPQFFRALGVADDTALTQPDRALHQLHFLATGKTPAREHELVFAKILCGIPLDRPAEGHIELTDNETDEAVNLLNTVIRYWDALKGTSPDGLRESFLRRPGKLVSSVDGGWELHVEKQTHDILLRHLPWGIGMIQLPWMPVLLHVEWEY